MGIYWRNRTPIKNSICVTYVVYHKEDPYQRKFLMSTSMINHVQVCLGFFWLYTDLYKSVYHLVIDYMCKSI